MTQRLSHEVGDSVTPVDGYTAAYFDTHHRVARALGPAVVGADWQVDHDSLEAFVPKEPEQPEQRHVSS